MDVTPAPISSMPIVSRQMITCLTADDERIEAPIEVLRVSRLFDGMCHNLGVDETSEAKFEGEFVVKNVDKTTMEKIVEWCKEHMGQPAPEVEFNQDENRRVYFSFTPFEERFLDVSALELCTLLRAANFLDIPSLYLYGSQKAAMMMEGMEQADIERMFEIYY